MVTTIPPAHECRLIQPRCFKENLTSDCTLAADCTDIFIEAPRGDLGKRRACYSDYRGGQTFKTLIAMLPSGAITYCSSFYGGKTSDKDICSSSGFYQQLTAGHRLAVDKGFLIEKELPQGVSLAMPSFRKKGSQFTNTQFYKSKIISRARSHVERINERIKNYSILRLLSHHYRSIATDILVVVCHLVNMQSSIMNETSDLLAKLN